MFEVISSSSTELVCQMRGGTGAYANYNYGIEVLVMGKGYALQANNFQLQYVPKVWNEPFKKYCFKS